MDYPAYLMSGSLCRLACVSRGMVSKEVLRYAREVECVNDENHMALCGNLSALNSYRRGDLNGHMLYACIETGDGVEGPVPLTVRKPGQCCAPRAWNSVVQFLCGEVEAKALALNARVSASLSRLGNLASMGMELERRLFRYGYESSEWDPPGSLGSGSAWAVPSDSE